MGYLNTGLSIFSSAVAAKATQGLALGAQAAWQGTRNTVQGRMGFGKEENVEKYRELRAAGRDVNYSEVARVNKMKNADGFQGFQRIDPYTGEETWTIDTEHGDFNERKKGSGQLEIILKPKGSLQDGGEGFFQLLAFGFWAEAEKEWQKPKRWRISPGYVN